MDYRLKRQVVAIMVFFGLAVLAIVLAANWKSLRRKLYPSPAVSSVSSEPEVEEEVADGPERNVLVGDNPTKWMTDDDFFDGSQIVSTAEKVSNEMRTLTISVTSVYQDLRISIYGYGHVLHTGEEFKVLLKNLDNPMDVMDYVDDDKDGIIYIPDLPAGEFAVSLYPTDGYVVPENSTRVMVKGQLERKKINDISLILKEHNEVLSKVEDSRYFSAADTASEDMLDDLNAMEYGTYGVEVSGKNFEVDFDTLYSEGIRFVMIRAGYRGSRSGDIFIDPCFTDYVSMAKRAGLEVGVYFYTQAVNEKEAVEEASALLTLCEDMYITMPLALVVDSAGGDGRGDKITVDERTIICSAFADTIKSEGYETLIYGSAEWLQNKVKVSSLEKYNIWLGDFNPVPLYEGVYDFWEYTSEGQIRGIKEDACLIIDMRK